jgi:hypothetical protein
VFDGRNKKVVLEISKKSEIIASSGDAGVAQLVERNLAKVEVESSRLFSRSTHQQMRLGRNKIILHAGVAQLVERNLAKVEVESSRLFSRSSVLRQ